MDNDYVSTKSITIFIIELGIWVILASGNLGCNGRPFFGGGRLLWIMMMFQQKLLKFSSLSLIYGLYEQVAIWDAMDGTFFDSGRLLRMMMKFQQNLFEFSSKSLVYGSY